MAEVGGSSCVACAKCYFLEFPSGTQWSEVDTPTRRVASTFARHESRDHLPFHGTNYNFFSLRNGRFSTVSGGRLNNGYGAYVSGCTTFLWLKMQVDAFVFTVARYVAMGGGWKNKANATCVLHETTRVALVVMVNGYLDRLHSSKHFHICSVNRYATIGGGYSNGASGRYVSGVAQYRTPFWAL